MVRMYQKTMVKKHLHVCGLEPASSGSKAIGVTTGPREFDDYINSYMMNN